MPLPDTLASQFFASLSLDNSAAFSYLCSLLGNETFPESEWLEFKNGKFLSQVREQWGKALSGFANGDGGIVIWGIQTKKINNLDISHSLSLVVDPKSLTGQLDEALKNIVDAPVLGVKIRAITQPDSTDGFVVAHIPRSRRRPHQVIESKLFYLRAGAQYVPLGAGQLRHMFYPETFADLQLRGHQASPVGDGSFNLRLQLRNTGDRTISDLFLVLSDRGGTFNFLEDSEFTKKAENEVMFIMSSKEALHPGMEKTFGTMSLKDYNRPTLTVYSRDTAPFKWDFRLSDDKFSIIIQD